jgi:hypothetical protein
MTRALPFLMILLSIGAAAVYGASGDLRRTIYWIAAATITVAVTF